jgi:signal transduction histidine kinase
MYRPSFLLLILLFFSFHVQSQSNYVIKNYSDIDGLPQNSIKSIAPDEIGYLWLATEGGLTRYDGYNFLLFDKFNTHNLSNRINSLKRNLKTGALYAETEYHELIQIKKGQTLPKSEAFKTIFPHADNPEFLMAESPLKYEHSPLFKVQLSSNQRCEIIKNKIIYYHLQNRKELEYKYNNASLFFASRKQLFHINSNTSADLIDEKGINKVAITGQLTDEKNASESTLKIFWNNANDQAFIYINKSVYQLQYNGKVLRSKLLLKDLDLIEKNIITIYYNEQSKKFFLGSLTQGLYIVQLPAFNSKMVKGQIDKSVRYALFPYNNHAVLFANGNLLQTDGKESRFPLINNYSNNYSITIDRQSNIWVQKGFSIFKLSENGSKLLEKHNFSTEASCLYMEQDSLLWIGTLGGIYTLDPAKSKSIPKELLKLKNVSILKKQGDNLWIGTYKGLFKYNLREKKLSAISKMSNYHIRSILLRQDEVWICTYGDGFYLYKGNKLKKMPLDKGKYLNTSHCLVEDKKGFFWVTTNKGLFQVAIKDLLAFYQGTKDFVYYNYFNQDYGFNINEFNGGCQPCGIALNDGNLVFPSLVGSVMFNPDLLQTELPDQPIYIDKILRDNKEIKSSDTLNINPDFERLNIMISTPYFGNRYNLQFEYKLKEENNWNQLDPAAAITFSTLSSGTHELLIRKASGFGQSYNHRSLIINVLPNFYQTWWFILVTAIIIMLFIFLIFKQRTSRILKQNKMLEELILDRTHELANNINNLKDSQNQLEAQSTFQKRLLAAITHDIKSPLKYMMITGKQLYINQEQSPNLKEVARAVYLSARNMFYFTENLLNYSKLFINDTQQHFTKLDLHKLIAGKIEIFSEAGLYNKIAFNNKVEKETLINTNELILSVIIHNLLDNAVKFSPGGEVVFSTIKVDNNLALVITDEGSGLPPEIMKWLNFPNSRELSSGLGLKMIKELAPKINVNVKAERLTKGTRFELYFGKID